MLRRAFLFVEVDGWLSFRYRSLNRLFRHLREVGEIATQGDNIARLAARYLASALLVRLCQYLLAICLELSSIPESDMRLHLTERLTYGDQDPAHVSSLIDGTITWIRRALEEKGVSLPSQIQVDRLYGAPSYTAEFIELISKLLDNAEAAIRLPCAMELTQFNVEKSDSGPPRVREAIEGSKSLVATLKGFVVRNLGVKVEHLEPVGPELAREFAGSKSSK